MKILRLELRGAINDKVILIAVGKKITMQGSSGLSIDNTSIREYCDEHGYEDYSIDKFGKVEEVVIGDVIEKG